MAHSTYYPSLFITVVLPPPTTSRLSTLLLVLWSLEYFIPSFSNGPQATKPSSHINLVTPSQLHKLCQHLNLSCLVIPNMSHTSPNSSKPPSHRVSSTWWCQVIIQNSTSSSHKLHTSCVLPSPYIMHTSIRQINLSPLFNTLNHHGQTQALRRWMH